MNMIEQGNVTNHLSLLRVFKQPSKKLVVLKHTVYILMSYKRAQLHICNLFKDKLQKDTYESFLTSLLLLGF